MSGEQFLRSRGWKQRAGHWEHPAFPDVLHSFQPALLQEAEWLSASLERMEAIIGDREESDAVLPAMKLSRIRGEIDSAQGRK